MISSYLEQGQQFNLFAYLFIKNAFNSYWNFVDCLWRRQFNILRLRNYELSAKFFFINFIIFCQSKSCLFIASYHFHSRANILAFPNGSFLQWIIFFIPRIGQTSLCCEKFMSLIHIHYINVYMHIYLKVSTTIWNLV